MALESQIEFRLAEERFQVEGKPKNKNDCRDYLLAKDEDFRIMEKELCDARMQLMFLKSIKSDIDRKSRAASRDQTRREKIHEES